MQLEAEKKFPASSRDRPLAKGVVFCQNIGKGAAMRPHRFTSLCAQVLFLLLFARSPFLAAQNLVSNVDGKIRTVIVHFGDGGWEGFWHDQTIFMRELAGKMDRDVGFLVLLGNDARADRVRQALAPWASDRLADGTSRIRFLVLDVPTWEFYPYARDPFLILADKNGGLTFLDAGFNEPPFPIVNFADVFPGARVQAGVIQRGGGNIRSSNEDIIIGMDTILGIPLPGRWGKDAGQLYFQAKTLDAGHLAEFRLRVDAHCLFLHHILAPDKRLVIPGYEEFFSRLGKKEFVFDKSNVRDTGAQAAYHTDVYIGLGHIDERGRRVAFVADSRLGALVVTAMTPERRREAERRLSVVLAAEGFNACRVPLSATQIESRFSWVKKKLLDAALIQATKIADRLDRTAEEMSRLGYSVVRVPYLPNGLMENAAEDEAFGIGFNYSNVLVEVFPGTKRVYIPEYGIAELDKAAGSVYMENGYTVVPILGLVADSVTNQLDGAGLDCLTNEIRWPEAP
jgi:hypothetical protein